MKLNFWQQRWQENQIGFHLDQVNPNLKKFWSTLKLKPQSHVLVPLCGKTLDLMWLAQLGHQVTGVECSQLAVDAFFAEHQVNAERKAAGDLQSYRANNLQLLLGDFFTLQKPMVRDVEAVYDRAALIALPAEMRSAYVAKLFEILPASASILLVTLEYNQSLMLGPPFSVPESEVQNLYNQHFEIQKLQQLNVLSNEPRFAQRGRDSLLETVYLLQPKILS